MAKDKAKREATEAGTVKDAHDNDAKEKQATEAGTEKREFSLEEIEARTMALRIMKVLREAAYVADCEGCPDGDEPDNPNAADNVSLLSAGEWGAALRKVCVAAWNVYFALTEDGDYWEADKAVAELEAKEEAERKAARRAHRKALAEQKKGHD